MMRVLLSGLTTGVILFASCASYANLSSVSTAAGDVPECLSKGRVLPIDNEQALTWKETSRNQFKSRAHVQGKLLKVYPDQSGHDHYQVQIGPRLADTIEIIYNQGFGYVPEAQVGADFEACGDYITSNAPSGRYPASPDGAIIHWVHLSTTRRHDSGFIVIDGVVCGLTREAAKPRLY